MTGPFSPDDEVDASADDASASPDDDLYRIGTVAQLTDISVERLRAWERRYGLAPAYRAGKTRFYSKEQVAHLSKIKRLIDQGHPIGSLAELSEAQLDERLSTQDSLAAEAAEPVRTGLIGPNLLVLEQQQTSPQRLEICARWANMEAFGREKQATRTLDAIVVQLPVLSPPQIERIEQACPDAHVVALYQFATPGQIAAVEERGIPTLKWPTPWRDIEVAAASFPRRRRASGATGRRFSDEELIAIAASALGDASACPQHLVELVSQLNAFADYARDCAEEADDAGLYRLLAQASSEARSHLEEALEALAIAEGLIPGPASKSP